MKWSCKTYKKLTLDEFHDLIQLREKVFIVEQNCPYLDVDGKDKQALHVIGKLNDEVIATARILSQGVSFKEVSIGRVVVSPKVRGKNIGKQLMEQSMRYIKNHFGNIPIRISAQTYLLEFYQSFGFTTVGEEYLEDNIPHFEMFFTSD